jgi:hypothetical protein
MSVKGEKYASKKAMMKHEKNEPMSARKMEYGKGLFGPKKKAAKKVAMKKMGKKK